MSPHNLLDSGICLIKLLRYIDLHKRIQADCSTFAHPSNHVYSFIIGRFTGHLTTAASGKSISSQPLQNTVNLSSTLSGSCSSGQRLGLIEPVKCHLTLFRYPVPLKLWHNPPKQTTLVLVLQFSGGKLQSSARWYVICLISCIHWGAFWLLA